MVNLRNKQGSTLLISCLLLIVLTIIAGAYVLCGTTEGKIAQRHAASTQAFWLGEAGIQKALWEYQNNNCRGFVQQGTSTACTDCVCGNADKSIAATLTNYGDYDITLDFNNTTIEATGSVPNRNATNLYRRRIRINLGGGTLFDHGVFSKTKITFGNGTTINGDVGTNGTASDTIVLGTGASSDVVNGQLSTGVGGGVSNLSNATVNGVPGNPADVTHTNRKSMPNVQVPSIFAGSAGALTVSNNATTNLGNGNYHYDNLNLKNNSTLNITGNVRLYLSGSDAITTKPGVHLNINSGANLVVYVDGAIDLSNNITINNVGATPGAFQIYSTYATATGVNGVTISNGGNLYAAVYAPQTGINITNNSFLRGAVLGNTITFPPNVNINFDSGLNGVPNSFGVSTGTVSNWQEF